MSGRFEQFDVEAFKGERRDFEAWRDSRRNQDDECSSATDMSEMLTPLFLYLADGYATRCLAERSAAILVLIAPHLIGADSYTEIAERLGSSHDSIANAVRKLRESIPALKGGYKPSQTSLTRLLSLCQVRQARRKAMVEEYAFRREESKKARKEWSQKLRARLADSRRAANLRALEAMREFDRVTGLCPEVSRRDKGQPSAPLGVRPDGSAAVGVVYSVEAKSLPRREGRWF